MFTRKSNRFDREFDHNLWIHTGIEESVGNPKLEITPYIFLNGSLFLKKKFRILVGN